MVRKIVEIDREKCNGCGACANACKEGAIGMVDGKAMLLKDDYCDGLGNCLPTCPMDAIHVVEREAADFDEAAVAVHMEEKKKESEMQANADANKQQTLHQMQGFSHPHGGCPGSAMRNMAERRDAAAHEQQAGVQAATLADLTSKLSMWPVQIKLLPIRAPFFEDANLLIAADCSAYAYGNFHNEFIKNRVCLIGCPKLDDIDYTEKLTEIIRQNNIKSVTIVRMEVPCCGGLEMAAKNALQASGKFIPWQVVTISIDGRKLD
jgi:ferredoxin